MYLIAIVILIIAEKGEQAEGESGYAGATRPKAIFTRDNTVHD